MSADPVIEPDTKDWTWVLERACPECGFDAQAVRRMEVKNRVYANASAWQGLLAAPDVRVRPASDAWSTLEYACHVRDVHLVFAHRVRQMISQDNPVFDNWDQDAAAVLGRYDAQEPSAVAADLVTAADEVSTLYAAVQDTQWDRSGRRGNGSVFTVESMARYHLHDVEHHLFDVSG